MYKHILVLGDNGHGADTAGKRTPKFPDGSFVHEHEFNQPTCTMFLALCEEKGFSVYDIAQGNANVSLKARTDLANKLMKEHKIKYPNGKVVLISFHYNAMSATWSNAEGIETFYYPGALNSKKLAELTQTELLKGTIQVNRKAKPIDFHMLRESHMVAILIEAGFMSNKREAGLMLNQNFQFEVAKESCDGVCKYFGVSVVDKVIPVVVKPIPTPQIIIPRKDYYEKIRFDGHSDTHIYRSSTAPKILLGTRWKRETLLTTVNHYKGIKAATNCGMFNLNDPKSEFYGLLISEGLYYQNSSPNFIDYICNKDGTVTIERVKDYTVNTPRLSNMQETTHFGIGTSWAIVNKGKKDFTNANLVGFEHSRQRHNRTMIAFDSYNKIYYSIVVDGRTKYDLGMNLDDQYKLSTQLSISEMANLDGGGSSNIYLKDKNIVSSDYKALRPIGTIVAYF